MTGSNSTNWQIDLREDFQPLLLEIWEQELEFKKIELEYLRDQREPESVEADIQEQKLENEILKLQGKLRYWREFGPILAEIQEQELERKEIELEHLQDQREYLLDRLEHKPFPPEIRRKTHSDETPDHVHPHPLESLRQLAEKQNYIEISRQIKRIETGLNMDPALAIGTSKEMLETCCKTILDEKGISFKDDMGQIFNRTMDNLILLPENTSDREEGRKAVRQFLDDTLNGIGKIRHLYGAGHGKVGNHQGPPAQHAELIVQVASSIVLFLLRIHAEYP